MSIVIVNSTNQFKLPKIGYNMPLSDDPVKREKQLANLKPLPAYLLTEYQQKQGKITKSAILEASKEFYPNLSKIADAVGCSRSLLTYHIDNDPELLEQMEQHFKRHLDEIENNVLQTAKKENYAGIGMGVLNRIHPRYKEEKQGNILANITINMPNISNPYDKNIDDAQIVDDSDT